MLLLGAVMDVHAVCVQSTVEAGRLGISVLASNMFVQLPAAGSITCTRFGADHQ